MIKPVIVAVGYNRIDSLQRLLSAIENAFYDDTVTLIISIDHGNNVELINMVNRFEWSHGEKIVKTHTFNMGLRKHIMECIDYSLEYGAAIIFEDDVMPSPYFYKYAKEAVNYYKDDERIFAVSLYSQLWNGYANKEFIPLKNEYDAYISQIECSWGECFIGERWREFKKWYAIREGKLKKNAEVPEVVYSWKESRSKYILYYIVENNKYFLTPYYSLSTNFNNAGTHISIGTSVYQVPLLYYDIRWKFPEFRSAIFYDSHFESIKLKEEIEKEYSGKNVCVDYFGIRSQYDGYELCFTTKLLNKKIIKSFGLEMRPPELNYYYEIPGDDLFLYDLSVNMNNRFPKRHHYNLIRYDVKELQWIDSLFYTLYTWYIQLKK